MYCETSVAEFTPEPADSHQRLEAVGEKLAGVLHDLGGPMGVIQGFAELMADEEDPATRAEFLTEIMRQVQRVTHMRDETLAFARGQRALLKSTVHLHQLVRLVAQTVEVALGDSGIDFELCANYRGPAELDEGQLLRAVENLARNAREAMQAGKGSRFRVDVAADGDSLLLAFTDDGPGIPEALAARLFDRFHPSSKAQGSGLGLYLVQQVARAHGGSAQCFSQPGVGTRFELRLPVLPALH